MIERLPQFRARSNPYHLRAVPELLRVTRAAGYQPGAYSLPGPDKESLPAKAILPIRLSLPVGTYLWAWAGSSSQADGFRVRINDLRQNANFFKGNVNWKNLTYQAATPEGIIFPLTILPIPRIVIEPAALHIVIENLSASTNVIQFVLFTAEPRP